MDPFKQYKIPFVGLSVGKHEYEFDLTETFFSLFEFGEIEVSEIHVDVVLDKGSNMMTLDFDVFGTAEQSCDRCGDTITVDLDGEYRLIVKFGDATDRNNDEILILGTAEYELDLSQYLYEYAQLSLPVKRVHENREDCNEDMIDLIDDYSTNEEKSDPRWDALKGLK